MAEMIELSVQVSEFMNYEIKIPRNLNSKTFPEVMKRLRAIYNMLPQGQTNAPTKLKGRVARKKMSPVLLLPLEESKVLLERYKKSTPNEINAYLKEEFGIEPKARDLVIGLMHRLKKRIYNLEAYRK